VVIRNYQQPNTFLIAAKKQLEQLDIQRETD
jgi:hypothetical protein